MLHILLLWIVAPISIYLGLMVFNNVVLTFAMFYGLVCLAIPIVDIVFIRKKTIKEYYAFLGLRNLKRTLVPSLIPGVVICFTVFAFFVFLQKYVLDIDQTQVTLAQWSINSKYKVPFVVTMILANSVFEEVYWRGYIYKKLENVVSARSVIVLTSLFYASYHIITTVNLFSLMYGVVFTSAIFGIGLFWGCMRRKYDSVFSPIIIHLLADLGIMLVYLKYFGS